LIEETGESWNGGADAALAAVKEIMESLRLADFLGGLKFWVRDFE
jgi:hypothetical protein